MSIISVINTFSLLEGKGVKNTTLDQMLHPYLLEENYNMCIRIRDMYYISLVTEPPRIFDIKIGYNYCITKNAYLFPTINSNLLDNFKLNLFITNKTSIFDF